MQEEDPIQLESLTPQKEQLSITNVMTRRSFLRRVGLGALAAAGSSFVGGDESVHAQTVNVEGPPLPEFNEIAENQKVIVVMLKQKDKQAPITVDQEREIMQHVADFYHKSSYGKFNLTFEVLDWQDVDQDLNSHDPGTLGTLADNRLTQLDGNAEIPDGLHLSDFQTRLYLIDQSGKGSISGYGTNRTPYNQAWIYQSEYTGGAGATKHELGHTLGLGHINGFGCQEKGDYTNNCTVTDTAGNNNLMANGYNFDLAAPQKLALGWISPDQVVTVAQNSPVITLTPNESDAQGKKIVRIQKPDTNEFYYVEYSVPDNLSFEPTLNFYIWDEKSTDIKQFAATDSFYSLDGGEFFDKVNGIRVRQVKHSNEEVLLSVQFGS